MGLKYLIEKKNKDLGEIVYLHSSLCYSDNVNV